jgi:CRP/FNR family transcriptional regulator, cyclic AMP receptor protein
LSSTGDTYGSFLALLDARERAALHALGSIRRFLPGAVLMHEHEPGEQVMILLHGRAKVTSLTNGHEALLSIRDPGDIVGELTFIGGAPRSATVAALEPVQALTIASSTFRTYLEETPRVAVCLLEVVTGRLRDATEQRAAFAGSDTLGRIAARLVELAQRYGAPGASGIEIEIGLRQDELAAWTGSSRAGTAAALRTLRELEWIETHRKRIVVRKIEPLRQRASARLIC